MRMKAPTCEDSDQSQHRDVLQRLPRGRFLLTASHGGTRQGLLVDRVQHCADDPPTIAVSVKKGHVLSPLIRDSARFGLCELAPSDRIITRLFTRSADLLDDDPFLGHALVPLEESHLQPIPQCGATWLACDLLRHLDIESDYELYIGRVITSGMLPAASAEPNSSARDRKIIPGRSEEALAEPTEDSTPTNRKRATA